MHHHYLIIILSILLYSPVHHAMPTEQEKKELFRNNASNSATPAERLHLNDKLYQLIKEVNVAKEIDEEGNKTNIQKLSKTFVHRLQDPDIANAINEERLIENTTSINDDGTVAYINEPMTLLYAVAKSDLSYELTPLLLMAPRININKPSGITKKTPLHLLLDNPDSSTIQYVWPDSRLDLFANARTLSLKTEDEKLLEEFPSKLKIPMRLAVYIWRQCQHKNNQEETATKAFRFNNRLSPLISRNDFPLDLMSDDLCTKIQNHIGDEYSEYQAIFAKDSLLKMRERELAYYKLKTSFSSHLKITEARRKEEFISEFLPARITMCAIAREYGAEKTRLTSTLPVLPAEVVNTILRMHAVLTFKPWAYDIPFQEEEPISANANRITTDSYMSSRSYHRHWGGLGLVYFDP
jgi:hypothetical protein